MTDFNELKKKWLKNPKLAAEYEALAPEFAIAGQLIRARAQAGMTQSEVADKMKTSQSRVAKMEGGEVASIDALQRYAEATGTKLNISLDPAR